MSQDIIIECIPNISEGRDLKVLSAIADSIKRIDAVQLLHMDRGEAANRTVFTFAGSPEAVVEAAYQAIKTAGKLIDMRQHQGTHPRIGAMDVCPLVPISNISIEQLNQYALELGKRIATDLNIPIYLYEHSAKTTQRKNLATIRSGEYEGLKEKMQSPAWQPDFGKTFNPKSGATVLGVRDFLIAYNVNLNTKSVSIATKIAQEIRESGKVIRLENGEKRRIAGKCPSLKAIGWFIEEYDKAQVSMNLTNFNITNIHQAFEACKDAAKAFDVQITGSELIGLIPLDALLQAGRFYLQKEGKSIHQSEEIIIQTAIKHLGLAELAPFNYQERIIEYLLKKRKHYLPCHLADTEID